jgi:2-polyprenyl-3-methyl-5-hydroxy-6-metoxy-1,4-benzoquinol methylase
MTDFVPHRAVWTREKSSRFWDQLSSLQGGDENYFSAEVGDSLIRFARTHDADLRGRVLDFGCGPGHLVRKLLAAGVKAEGADFSPTSIERLRETAAGNPNFGGASLIESLPSTALPSDTYSTVFFVETIEHLLEDDLRTTIAELHRIVRPGGHVVVTTPNDEKLQIGDTVCPDCGCVFHRVQHVRSWTASSIVAAMSEFGFETVAAKAWYLDPRWWRSRLITTAARALHKRLPHLIYIGRKGTAR